MIGCGGIRRRLGSGTFQPVDEEWASILEFGEDGYFKEIKGPVSSSINPYDTYALLDDNRLELRWKGDTNAPPVIWHYSNLTPSTLTISYGCIEPCKANFVAIP